MSFLKFKKFIAYLKSISLSTDEKELLRLDFLHRTGLEKTTKSKGYLIYSFLHYAKVTAYSLVIFLIGIVPFTFAAEKAHPGDILYPFKIAVNEPLKHIKEKIIWPIKEEEVGEERSKSNKDEDEQNEGTNDSRDRKNNSRDKDNEEKQDKVSRKIIDQHTEKPFNSFLNTFKKEIPLNESLSSKKEFDTQENKQPIKEEDKSINTGVNNSKNKSTESIEKNTLDLSQIHSLIN